jgi:glycosyltransferase involved in cell wall biosynthesis
VSTRPTVSVVMPAYNAEQTIEAQLEALSKQTYPGPWEVVLSDNGSTDGTLPLVVEWSDRLPSLRIVQASTDRGAAYARNAGAAATIGDIIAFCDADDVAEPTWLEELISGLGDSDIVAGALEQYAVSDPDIAASRGMPHAALPTTLHFLPYACGSNMAVRRDVWSAVGGWPADYPGAAAEDVSFSWRAQLAGYEIAFAPKAIVHYRLRDSVWGNTLQVFRYATAEVRLYKDFRVAGARRRDAKELWQAYRYLLVRVPFLLGSRRRRATWLVAAASNAGRIRGSFEHRVFAP